MTKNKPDYYGGVNPDGTNRTELKGMVSSFVTRKSATSEKNLFKPTSNEMMIRGIYLQPDEPIVVTDDLNQTIVANLAKDDRITNMIQRLSTAIGAGNKGMSLIGKQGQRWQFGASRAIRHTAAPDNTSITFATKSDLLNHWIIPITLLIDRDWAWDGVQPASINIFRKNIFLKDAMKLMGEVDRDIFLNKFNTEEILTNAAVVAEMEEILVGDLELKRAINIQALVNSDRTQTYACFIDAAEPKHPDEKNKIFTDELLVSYRISVNYFTENNVAPEHDNELNLFLHLPITIPPYQMPKIVSAGLAASKYVRDTDYANTETRKRYLWIEFEEPIQNPDDAYFARMLAYSPDPLLANWESYLFAAPKEPALPIDPEQIRIITSASSDEKSGLNAMQQMIPATDSDVHYLVPLPQGLHADSLEFFGFFTYEFRVGHKIPWSTAQGRFGRPLRNTGVQHPTPQLYCIVNRNEKYITVTAPFAQTVFDGRNVTANPPRTNIWALLYAQVRMANDSDQRNVLLADKKLIVTRRIDIEAYLKIINTNSEAPPEGVTGWTNKDVEEILTMYGLPENSSLSILCVEMMPGYDDFTINTDSNRFAHLTYFDEGSATVYRGNVQQTVLSAARVRQYLENINTLIQETRNQKLRQNAMGNNNFIDIYSNEDLNGPRPLTTDLGNYRILRTSTLVAVPEVCCTV